MATLWDSGWDPIHMGVQVGSVDCVMYRWQVRLNELWDWVKQGADWHRVQVYDCIGARTYCRLVGWWLESGVLTNPVAIDLTYECHYFGMPYELFHTVQDNSGQTWGQLSSEFAAVPCPTDAAVTSHRSFSACNVAAD